MPAIAAMDLIQELMAIMPALFEPQANEIMRTINKLLKDTCEMHTGHILRPKDTAAEVSTEVS